MFSAETVVDLEVEGNMVVPSVKHEIGKRMHRNMSGYVSH